MKIIPVIDLKDGAAVHARQGNRKHYRPINSPLCESSNIYRVIEAFLSIYEFETFYIADLNAITNQGDHHQLITEVLARFPEKTFWIDRGYQKYGQQILLPSNYIPVLGSESYRNETISELAAYQNNFILSLDYASSNALGAENLFSDSSYWPENIIIMTLERVGSNQGPDLDRLSVFCGQHPNKNFIAAGGIRNILDLANLAKTGIRQALVASALHSGALNAKNIAELQMV